MRTRGPRAALHALMATESPPVAAAPPVVVLEPTPIEATPAAPEPSRPPRHVLFVGVVLAAVIGGALALLFGR